MATVISKTWSLLLQFMIVFTNAAIIEPTISNASGEYYIIKSQPSEPPTIICDASKSNTSTCYIACSHFGCTNLNLTCTSNTCNIDCDEDSCESMNITSTSKQIDLYCYTSGCEQSQIEVSLNSKLNMICDGPKACKSSQLRISNLSYYTNITCDGESDTKSCNDIKISVPYPYQQNFVSFNFNNNGDHSVHSGSADNIIINCIGQETCTQYTKGPIISTAEPIMTNKTGIYYIAENNSYKYRWQAIICAESQNCYINCTTTESCSNSYIECKHGSNCYIYCDKNHGCSYAAIRSTDKTNTKIQCEFYHDQDVENYLFWKEGCLYTTIESYADVTLTCSGQSEDNSLRFYIGGCFETKINCTSGFEDSCNLICPMAGCQPTIIIPSSFKNGFLTVSGYVTDTKLVCAEGTNEFLYDGTLKYYSPCMPWHDGGDNIISCSDKTECSISCNENDKTDNPYFDQYGCSYQTIAGSDVEKLSVICDETAHKVCKGMDIFCGINECEILCEDCSSSTIHAVHTETVIITSTISVPSYLTVNASNAGSVIFKFPANGNYEPYDITIYAEHADYVGIGDVISNSDIYAQYAQRVDINCTSCNGLSVDASYAGHVSYQCNNKNGCKNNDLYAQNAVQLNISALSHNNIIGPSMSDNNIFFVAENTNLFCQDNGCLNATFYTINGLQDIHTIWNGTCKCGDSVGHCINQWIIYCNDDNNNDTYSKYNGQCVGDNNRCCSSDTAKVINDDFNTYYNNNHCLDINNNTILTVVIVLVAVFIVVIAGIIWYFKNKKGKNKKGKEAMLLSEHSSTIQ